MGKALSFFLFVLLSSQALSQDVSVKLPAGFVPMKGSNPPAHESYLKSLGTAGHSLTFSADRRALEDAYALVKKHGDIMKGPVAAGILAMEVERTKAQISKSRNKLRVEKSKVVELSPTWHPNDLCEGLKWTATLAPTTSSDGKSKITMNGATVVCVFFGSKSAWVTGATVSEQKFLNAGLKPTNSFDKTARRILKSLRY